MCRRCVIRKGLAVGKSTEMGSEAIKAWYKEQLGRLGLKENLMELFKAELSGTYMRVGPTFDFSKLKLTPRSHEWLQEYRRRHPNPVNLGKLICETEPIMTREPEELVVTKREPVESSTVKNYRNADGEVVRTEYFNEKGELVMTEEVIGMECRDPTDIELLHPNPDQQAHYEEQVKMLEQASLQAGRLCQKGIPGCRCAEGWPVEEQCADCRGDKPRKSRCECPPKDCSP